MGTVCRKTATKPLPAGERIIVHKRLRLAATNAPSHVNRRAVARPIPRLAPVTTRSAVAAL